MLAVLRDWAVHRFGLEPIYDNALNRRVPKTPWYYGDGATLMLLFGVLVLTGMVLALTYSPVPEQAHETVDRITNRQVLGWFVRGLHYWSAGLMVVMLFFHLLRLILVGGYKYPREGSWIIGVLMMFGLLAMSYIGYLLRWDERAVHALQVSLHMAYRVPWLGEWLVAFIQGGDEIGPSTLTRFYALHVIILPMLLGLLAGYHLYLIMLRGVTSPAERRQPIHSVKEQDEVYHESAESEEEGETFYPFTVFKSGAMAGVVFGIVVVLTLVLGPPPLQDEANFVASTMPAEEWWFWWYSGLIALLPPSISPWFFVLFPALSFLLLILLPFADRGPYRGIRKRPFALAFVLMATIALVGLSDYRRRSPFTGWPDSNPPPVPEGFTLTPRAEEGRQLFAKYGCTSCHSVAGDERAVGTDLALLNGSYSREEIRQYTLKPPPGVAMPAYEGRISDEDLERVVEFCHVAQTFPRQR